MLIFLSGFAVAYFQVPWATKNGALQTFGVEAALVAALFLLIVPALQWKGRDLRVSITVIKSSELRVDMIFVQKRFSI